MNEEMIALAQRLIDCPRFRWMPGMSSVAYRQAPLEPVVHRIGDLKLTPYPGSLPNLADPATLGCLLALVREAWGDPRAYLCDYGGYDSVEWGVVSHEWDAKRQAEGPKAWFSCLLGDAGTEAEALVVALEAAP